MSVKLVTKYLSGFYTAEEYEVGKKNLKSAIAKMYEASEGFETARAKDEKIGDEIRVGWRTWPDYYDRDEFDAIKAAAKKIQGICGKDGVLVVLGIGGSYLGARAAIDFVKSPNYNLIDKDTPDVYFGGNTLSPSAAYELLELCKGKSICVNVISKSGTTTETSVAFRLFRDYIVETYGEEDAKNRIFATTDRKSGKLKEFADKAGYQTFVVPEEIGGRYSVLTPVGLLPIAVAGIDIDDMMKGAADAMNELKEPDIEKNDAYKYAVLRNIFYGQEKCVELYAAYDPALQMTQEWLKQLYGESEGKEHKGLFPASVVNTTDLHSLGQYVQQGRRIMFETVLHVLNPNANIDIKKETEDLDGLNFLAGKTLNDLNEAAFKATVLAHTDGGVPNIIFDIDSRSAYDFGYMVYFFELACAISGYILGINPFDQPGVEAYKKNMFALLGKPGYENDTAKIEAKLSALENN